jgi:uncharacterized protein YxjI
MKRELGCDSNLFLVFDENSKIKYRVVTKNKRFLKSIFLLDSFGNNMANIKKFSFPLVSVYFIKIEIFDVAVIENRVNFKPIYHISRTDWIFKNSSKAYYFSVVDQMSEILMTQYKDVITGEYNIEIFKENFEIPGICISVCVNNLIINENKVLELT